MADGYGEVADYGELDYKQDIEEGTGRSYAAMVELWPLPELLEDEL